MESFIKAGNAQPLAFEAASLRWLANAQGAEVVNILELRSAALVLERVALVQPTAIAAAQFGTALARTHNAGAAAFGSAPDFWVGDGYLAGLRLILQPEVSWGEFLAQQRVLPYAQQAFADRSLSTAEFRVIEQLCERLSAGDFDDDATPARIHGDLWAGNVLFSPTGVVLIDAAAHGGHRITDLAMLSLFGAPYLENIFSAYETESGQLPERWRSFIPLHQVHPLLVHAVLFGGGYGAQATVAASRYV